MMIYTCHSELCVIIKDCNCDAECCSGELTVPMVIEYISDQEIKTNKPNHEYEVQKRKFMIYVFIISVLFVLIGWKYERTS